MSHLIAKSRAGWIRIPRNSQVTLRQGNGSPTQTSPREEGGSVAPGGQMNVTGGWEPGPESEPQHQARTPVTGPGRLQCSSPPPGRGRGIRPLQRPGPSCGANSAPPGWIGAQRWGQRADTRACLLGARGATSHLGVIIPRASLPLSKVPHLDGKYIGIKRNQKSLRV